MTPSKGKQQTLLKDIKTVADTPSSVRLKSKDMNRPDIIQAKNSELENFYSFNVVQKVDHLSRSSSKTPKDRSSSSHFYYVLIISNNFENSVIDPQVPVLKERCWLWDFSPDSPWGVLLWPSASHRPMTYWLGVCCIVYDYWYYPLYCHWEINL